MHLIHHWTEDEDWPVTRLQDPAYRQREEVQAHRSCACGRGQCQVLSPLDPRDPLWLWVWEDDAKVVQRLGTR